MPPTKSITLQTVGSQLHKITSLDEEELKGLLANILELIGSIAENVTEDTITAADEVVAGSSEQTAKELESLSLQHDLSTQRPPLQNGIKQSTVSECAQVESRDQEKGQLKQDPTCRGKQKDIGNMTCAIEKDCQMESEENLCKEKVDIDVSIANNSRIVMHYNLYELVQLTMDALITICQPPAIPKGLEEEDGSTRKYTCVAKRECCLNFISDMLHLIVSKASTEMKHLFAKPPAKVKRVDLKTNAWTSNLLLSLAPNGCKMSWNSEQSVISVSKAEQSLQELFEGNNLQMLLTGRYNAGLEFKALIKSHITKDAWKRHPGVVQSYVWFLNKLTFPHLSEFLDVLLPPALILLDDYRLDNKIKGVQCVSHILKHAGKAELKWFGRADVLYQALFHLTYTKEPSLARELYPCLLSVLEVVCGGYHQISQSFEDSKLDTVFRKLLQDMHMEDNLNLREAYSLAVPQFVYRLTIRAAKHSKKLLCVLTGYLEIGDYARLTRFHMLTALKCVIEETWPCLHHHTVTIIKSLLRLMVDLSEEKGHQNLVLEESELAIGCLVLLSQTSPTALNIVTQVLNKQANVYMVKCLQTIQDVTIATKSHENLDNK